MDPFAQAHLSELLAAARMKPTIPPPDPDEHRVRTLMTYNAALEALKGAGAISQEEMADWSNRMRVVLARSPSSRCGREPPGSSTSEGRGSKNPSIPRIRHRFPDSSVWSPLSCPTGPCHTAVGSRFWAWNSTAAAFQSTGGWHHCLTPRSSSPRNSPSKSPTSRISPTISRRSSETNWWSDSRCNAVPCPLATMSARNTSSEAVVGVGGTTNDGGIGSSRPEFRHRPIA
jgi:hypothetical protein